MKDDVKALAIKFFELLWIVLDDISCEEEENNIFFIKISTKQSWEVIWPMWKHLESIRNILRTMCSKKFTNKIIIHIEVNDYLESKDKKLFKFIQSRVNKVRETWKEIILPFYTSYERKKIHSFISELKQKNVFTKSFWEGRERRLHICKKSEVLKIDLDGIDI